MTLRCAQLSWPPPHPSGPPQTGAGRRSPRLGNHHRRLPSLPLPSRSAPATEVFQLPGRTVSLLLLPLRLGDWNREAERRAPVRVALRPQPPAVGDDDGPTDRQSHAEPVALGGVKGLEDPLEVAGAY